MSNFSNYLKKRRAELDLSYGELAKLSGVSKSYLIQLESGERDTPHPDKLRGLAPALQIPYMKLMHIAGYVDATAALKAAGVNYMLIDDYVRCGLTEAEIKQTLDFLVYHKKNAENVE